MAPVLRFPAFGLPAFSPLPQTTSASLPSNFPFFFLAHSKDPDRRVESVFFFAFFAPPPAVDRSRFQAHKSSKEKGG